jgi:hypothetical protein
MVLMLERVLQPFLTAGSIELTLQLPALYPLFEVKVGSIRSLKSSEYT